MQAAMALVDRLVCNLMLAREFRQIDFGSRQSASTDWHCMVMFSCRLIGLLTIWKGVSAKLWTTSGYLTLGKLAC
jgi:hypothetical protein